MTPTGSPSGNRSTRIAEGGYPLQGVSNPPDPETHAYRQDLADVSLAGCVIASHYAEPLLRHVVQSSELRQSAADDADVLCQLQVGDEMWMLDDTSGWAWGYAGPGRRVGYVRAEALGL